MNSAPASKSPLSFLAGGGEMARRIREFDWAQHPLGPPENWPGSLKVVVHLMLSSRFAMWMGWGPEFYFFCNDAYLPTLGIKRNSMLGLSATKVWEEIWADIGPRAESVVRTGEATWDECLMLFLERSGFAEETYHTFSYSPISDDDGSVGGMLCVVTEETERVIGERRLALLRDLGSDLATIKSEEDVCRAVVARLGERPQDLPFALIYLRAVDGKAAHLASAYGAVKGTPLAPELILGEEGEPWPMIDVFAKSASVLVDDLTAHRDSLPSAPWGQLPRSALLVPIAQQGQEQPAGFLVAGLNPYRPLDAAYRGFLDLLAGQIAAGIASARAYEAERKRSEALEELDRAKTAFFSNVSHEFRTPLTLMLGPLAELVENSTAGLPAAEHGLVTVAHRNGMRLLKLVNSLLDFSRMEAGRVKACFEPTDFASYTAELASLFRSAMEKAGLDFQVECPPLPQPVYLDHEMWEKVVLNLLSNAFKFTLSGGIRIGVRALESSVEMTVRDTGAGIPDDARPHLFERFYRVQGVESRTHEGSGIGLALVHELVKTHGGTVRVESEIGQGSTFVVTLPFGSAHLPQDQCTTAAPSRHGAGALAKTFITEALRWLPDAAMPDPLTPGNAEHQTAAPRPRIILADDNADMREYIARLLSADFEVITVADGQAALDAALDVRPDLVLTDVMMPRLDGFGLLRQMRVDPGLQSVPVILLSARAGEEARVAGLEAGADDYLIKPFHARELLAKINSTLMLARIRAEAVARETELRTERTEILEGMNIAFMALDPDYRIIYLNNEAAELYNLVPEKYLGRDHWDAFPATIGTLVETNYRRAMEKRIAVRFENHYAPWDQWFEINAYPMSRGRLGIFFREITARKKTEKLLREAKEGAELANQSKDRFLAVLSHELRTPLTPVLLSVTALEHDADLPAAVREDLIMIKRNIELETKLIDDLLDLSRITSGKLALVVESVDLNEVVRQVCRICAPQLREKEVLLETDLDAGVGMVAADSARLQQVLWNVLKNAIKFTPAKGMKIQVTTTSRDDGCCEVRVTDHGIGIPAESLPHVFNAFEQGGESITRQFGGLGLGLAICKALMDLHHGSIRAESAGAGQGTTFIIELPAQVMTTTAKIHLASPSEGPELALLRVLLVEDHSDTARILSRQLGRAGITAVQAGDVASAIQLAASQPFDLLLSDLGLPDGSGYDVMRHIRATYGIPGIAMSGYGMEEDMRRSREAGFSAHLVKPIDLRELISSIRRLAMRT